MDPFHTVAQITRLATVKNLKRNEVQMHTKTWQSLVALKNHFVPSTYLPVFIKS